MADTKDEEVRDGDFVTVEGTYSRTSSDSEAVDGTIRAEAVCDIEDLRSILDDEGSGFGP